MHSKQQTALIVLPGVLEHSDGMLAVLGWAVQHEKASSAKVHPLPAVEVAHRVRLESSGHMLPLQLSCYCCVLDVLSMGSAAMSLLLAIAATGGRAHSVHFR